MSTYEAFREYQEKSARADKERRQRWDKMTLAELEELPPSHALISYKKKRRQQIARGERDA